MRSVLSKINKGKSALTTSWAWLLPLVVLVVLFFVLKNQTAKLISYLNTLFKSLGSSMSNDEAKGRAQKLYIAMDDYGTDEDAVYDALKETTEADYNKISNYFGLRPYGVVTGTGVDFIGENMNLSAWLLAELNNYERDTLKGIAPYLKNYGF